jgi:hypothetical protein
MPCDITGSSIIYHRRDCQKSIRKDCSRSTWHQLSSNQTERHTKDLHNWNLRLLVMVTSTSGQVNAVITHTAVSTITWKKTKSIKKRKIPIMRLRSKSITFMQLSWKKFFGSLQYNSFSDEFWRTWISAIDEMRFCVGLGGKQDAYVRCSCTERDAVFSTAGRNLYHTLPMTEMEERILSLARFVANVVSKSIRRTRDRLWL